MTRGLGFCLRCGESIKHPVALASKTKYICPTCGATHYGPPAKIGRVKACQRCERIFDRYWLKLPIEDWECMPSRSICETCRQELQHMTNVVKAGGIYWRCSDCDNSGVFTAESAVSIQVRKQNKVRVPGPIGVTLNKNNCPVCAGQVGSGTANLLGRGE